MIDDMVSLKQAMQQMDAQDPVAAQAAKDRAAQLLSNANSSFSKMADLIEQRRLLLRPKIVASIRRMDQPEMLGEAAFRDAGSALRHEGQSFRQIAEAIELSGNPALRYEDPVQKSGLFYGVASEPGALTRARAANVVLRIIFSPLRHPVRFLTIVLLATVVFNVLRGATIARQISGFVESISGARQRTDSAMTSASSFFGKRTSQQSDETAAPPTPPAPTPSAPTTPSSPPPSNAPATASAPPTTTAESAPPVPQPSVSAAPPSSTPRLEARGAASRSAANERPPTVGPRVFERLMPAELRRNSRSAGRCIGGTGGCYWGGGQY